MTTGDINTVAGGNSGNAMSLKAFNNGDISNVDTVTATTAPINTAGVSKLAVSFDYSGLLTETGDKLQLFASFGGDPFIALSGLLPLSLTNNNAGLAWTTFFLASFDNPNLAATSTVLKFELRSTQLGEFAYVDNVSLSASAVPLPAALPLFAGGLGLMGWMARRRRGQAAHA